MIMNQLGLNEKAVDNLPDSTTLSATPAGLEQEAVSDVHYLFNSTMTQLMPNTPFDHKAKVLFLPHHQQVA